jgi:hypothetical protein
MAEEKKYAEENLGGVGTGQMIILNRILRNVGFCEIKWLRMVSGIGI